MLQWNGLKSRFGPGEKFISGAPSKRSSCGICTWVQALSPLPDCWAGWSVPTSSISAWPCMCVLLSLYMAGKVWGSGVRIQRKYIAWSRVFSIPGGFRKRLHNHLSEMFKSRLIFNKWKVELRYFQQSLYSFCLRIPWFYHKVRLSVMY